MYARKLWNPTSIRNVDSDSNDSALSTYINNFVSTSHAGIVFIEVSENQAGPWELFRCDVLLSRSTFARIISQPCTEDEARRITKIRESAK